VLLDRVSRLDVPLSRPSSNRIRSFEPEHRPVNVEAPLPAAIPNSIRCVPVRLVSRQRVATIGDELIETEHVGITNRPLANAFQPSIVIFASLMIGPHFSIIEAAAQ
jgi:hypothetical protein